MKRNLFFVVAILMIAAMALSACAQATAAPTQAPATTEAPAAAETTAAPTEAAPTTPIKIGTSLPLTGEFSITGTKHRDGYQLCVDLINEAGGINGRTVDLVVSDNQSDVDTTLAQMERFINVDKVDLIFGTFSSKLTFPATAITEKAKMLHPIPSAAALRVYERGFKYLVYFQPNAAEYIGASPVMMIKDLIPADQQPKTIALAWADDFYANALIAGLTGEDVKFTNDDGTEKTVSLAPGELSKLDAKIVFKQQWPEGFTDWTTLAASIKAANADYLFAPVTSADEAINLVRALQQVNYNPKGIFMSQGAQKEFGEALGSAANGITIQASWHPLANFTGLLNGKEFTNQMFLDAFKAKYGVEGGEDEAIPFALCQGIEQAVRATGSTDNTVLRDWLAARTAEDPVKTILGDFYWDSRGLPINKSFIMTQWQDGKLEFVYPTDAFPGVKPLVYPKPAW
ncbi:MAG: amino acid ABC transporter substrate-binding protein [Anaerolineaceae bacterium]